MDTRTIIIENRVPLKFFLLWRTFLKRCLRLTSFRIFLFPHFRLHSLIHDPTWHAGQSTHASSEEDLPVKSILTLAYISYAKGAFNCKFYTYRHMGTSKRIKIFDFYLSFTQPSKQMVTGRLWDSLSSLTSLSYFFL